ncbi:Secretion Associated Ras Related GTPase 1, C (SAR1C) [Carpediemonas membranifera]|uniref:Secretion Associated Ras Related GTPase 1 B (SAR1B) n=1 Tax=Carpediemonas membranifera TaxID=201153 RepID=A0A8J6E0P0_9EUKA|nr:Secretion Associated Ras Related GTPase 1 B (SAR1B) [Carpediemonas membranifera]KAG9396369.1 Secretion Associated Ras Related GTPase 1, C (SAR1C) [Carpediemonas membranifera]|eukprot:KAG9392468.1 Secretion Associated Ras Related GTPase 1 B (SAR1B) [Carpediemonas membranifera]
MVFSFTNWFLNMLSYLGLYNKKAKLVFLGLDNAGKTTLLHMLKDGKLVQHQPTLHPTNEEIRMGKITFSAFDLGGHKEARRIWQDYYAKCDAVIYIVDAADHERMQESADALRELLESEELAGVPFAILGNKIDRPDACSEPQFMQMINIHTTGKHATKEELGTTRPIEVFMCSILRKTGYAEGFRWIGQYL